MMTSDEKRFFDMHKAGYTVVESTMQQLNAFRASAIYRDFLRIVESYIVETHLAIENSDNFDEIPNLLGQIKEARRLGDFVDLLERNLKAISSTKP